MCACLWVSSDSEVITIRPNTTDARPSHCRLNGVACAIADSTQQYLWSNRFELYNEIVMCAARIDAD